MTAVGDIIQPGQSIPDDVTEMGDRDTLTDGWARWVRHNAKDAWDWASTAKSAEKWRAAELVGGRTSSELVEDGKSQGWAPFRVLAVREQPAEPERKLIGPPHAHLDAPCTDACYEPPAEPVPDVLDLVRQYGAASHQDGYFGASARPLFARIEAEVQRLRDELDKARTTAGSVTSSLKRAIDDRDEARRQRDRARYERDLAVRLTDEIRNEREEALAEVERLKAAQPDPLVLSLPTGTVALIGGETHRRYACIDFPYRWKREDGLYLLLGEVFADEGGSVTVVMREPRTWPRLDGAPDDVRKVEVWCDGSSFVAVRRKDDRWGAVFGGDPRGAVEALELHETYSWSELLGEGEVREVFDDKDGTR